jgi:hypothetical protein
MIQQINDYFNKIGKIFKRTSDNSVITHISRLKNCLIIRDHFLNYSLLYAF